jgi:two-component system sensor histidine kinase HydH
MTGQILYRVTFPAILLVVLLVAACLGGVWSITHLQAYQSRILSKNVQSLLAAQELELRLRQLRYHSFVFVMDPSKSRKEPVDLDIQQFEEALAKAERSADQPEERTLIESVKEGYQQYRHDLGNGPEPGAAVWSREQLLRWADAHSLRQLAARCEELSRCTELSMAETAAASERIGDRTRYLMLLVGGLGPLCGLLGGYLIARSLGRRLTRLVVRVQDLNAQLDQEVDRLGLEAGMRWQDLDRQLDHVVQRVRAVVVQAQEQQQEMLRAEQLAAVGHLAAGIAHEIRNPLTSIKLLVGAARSRGGKQALSPEDLQVIHQEVERLEGKAQTLLDFARPIESRRRACELNAIVASSIELVRTRAGQQSVHIEYAAPADKIKAFVDPDQIASVLVNLYFNALDAMPNGGRLSVKLVRAERAILTVTDDGSGINPSLGDRLFTPFVSSKATGTGLGLSVSRRIVLDHGGTLNGANRVGATGACFTIELPLLGDEDADSTSRR